MLVRAADPTIDGGLVIAVEHEWTYGPSWAPPYETRGLKALRDDPMGAETILEISAVFTDSEELPTWFQWKYGDVSLRRRLYDARRTPAELTSLFADYAESHDWTKNPRPSTPESWIGRHGGTEPTDGMSLTVAPISGSARQTRSTARLLSDLGTPETTPSPPRQARASHRSGTHGHEPLRQDPLSNTD